MKPDFAVRVASLDDPQVRQLLALHLAGMHANSPPEAVFALDLSGLAVPEVTIWGAWDANSRLAAIGALNRFAPYRAEVKSMRTHPDFLRQGAAAALLEAIIAEARAEGITRLSLETGSGDAFEPALALYRKRGFANGEAYGGYAESAFNQFLHLELA